MTLEERLAEIRDKVGRGGGREGREGRREGGVDDDVWLENSGEMDVTHHLTLLPFLLPSLPPDQGRHGQENVSRKRAFVQADEE